MEVAFALSDMLSAFQCPKSMTPEGKPSGSANVFKGGAGMAKVREIKLISHSDVFYWWPAWVVGYVMALVSYGQGSQPATDGSTVISYINPSNNPGLIFITVIALLVIFTNSKLRGIYSVVTIVTIAFFAVLFAWLDWWDEILSVIPNLSAHANMGFYLVFASALLLIWLLGMFIFDRLTYWRVRPGQLIEWHLVGGGEQTYDTNGLLFEKREQDLFRHWLLGLGAGDLRLTARGKDVIDIRNVLFANSKVKAIEKMVAVKPDQPDQVELVMPSST
jgi:hypothetical protein